MQQSVGAGDVDQRAIDGDVGGNGNGVVDKRNSRGRVGVEVIDQNAAAIARDDVGLSGIWREEEVNGVERALADVDVDRSEGCVLSSLGEGDDLGTERGERSRRRGGGDNVDAGIVDAEEKVEATRLKRRIVPLPMWTLPAGTILRNMGGVGRPGAGRLTGELSQVL